MRIEQRLEALPAGVGSCRIQPVAVRRSQPLPQPARRARPHPLPPSLRSSGRAPARCPALRRSALAAAPRLLPAPAPALPPAAPPAASSRRPADSWSRRAVRPPICTRTETSHPSSLTFCVIALLAKRVSAERPPCTVTSTSLACDARRTRSKISPHRSLSTHYIYIHQSSSNALHAQL